MAIRGLAGVNALLEGLGRQVAVVCLALMTVCILIQIVFRYVLNSALPWPDEAARFLMLWMAGAIAPLAFRRGGFVAIDTLKRALPGVLAGILGAVLLGLSLWVLVVAARLGWAEVTGFAGSFSTAALYVPLGFGEVCQTGLAGLKSVGAGVWCRIPRSWMMASLLWGTWGMVLVCVELIARHIVAMAGGQGALPAIATVDSPGGSE